MSLRDQVFDRLAQEFGDHSVESRSIPVSQINGLRVNVRAASYKGGMRYWFDVTPSLYERKEVDVFVFGCGSSTHMYVFPANVLESMVADANLGGQKQVPNFNIHLDSDELVPCGTEHRFEIATYYNAFKYMMPAPAP